MYYLPTVDLFIIEDFSSLNRYCRQDKVRPKRQCKNTSSQNTFAKTTETARPLGTTSLYGYCMTVWSLFCCWEALLLFVYEFNTPQIARIDSRQTTGVKYVIMRDRNNPTKISLSPVQHENFYYLKSVYMEVYLMKRTHSND